MAITLQVAFSFKLFVLHLSIEAVQRITAMWERLFSLILYFPFILTDYHLSQNLSALLCALDCVT